jgi:hypothetical protein
MIELPTIYDGNNTWPTESAYAAISHSESQADEDRRQYADA